MTQALVAFNPDQVKIIRDTVAKDTTPEQFALFIEVCKASGLNPFARQIYAVVRNAKQGDGWVKQMTVQTSIDGYRLLAERSGKYAGQIGPEWCGEDGAWKDVWLSDKPPAASRVGIIRQDFQQPIYGVAKYKSYVQTGKEGNPTTMWLKMPDVMLAKCAESLALRKAFPAEMSGLYTAEEMAQADRDQVIDVPAVVVESAPVAPEQPKPSRNGKATPAPAPAQNGAVDEQRGPTVEEINKLRTTAIEYKLIGEKPFDWQSLKCDVFGVMITDERITKEQYNQLLAALRERKQAKAAQTSGK